MITDLNGHVRVARVELQVIVRLRLERGSTSELVVANTQRLEIVHAQHDATGRGDFECGKPLRVNLGQKNGSEHGFHIAFGVSRERGVEGIIATLHDPSRTFAVVYSVVDGHFNVIGIFL